MIFAIHDPCFPLNSFISGTNVLIFGAFMLYHVILGHSSYNVYSYTVKPTCNVTHFMVFMIFQPCLLKLHLDITNILKSTILLQQTLPSLVTVKGRCMQSSEAR